MAILHMRPDAEPKQARVCFVGAMLPSWVELKRAASSVLGLSQSWDGGKRIGVKPPTETSFAKIQ